MVNNACADIRGLAIPTEKRNRHAFTPALYQLPISSFTVPFLSYLTLHYHDLI